MTMKMRLKMKNRPQQYNINRPRPRHGPKYTKYKMCLSIMVICFKQRLSDISSSIHEKVNKKALLIKKHVKWQEAQFVG